MKILISYWLFIVNQWYFKEITFEGRLGTVTIIFGLHNKILWKKLELLFPKASYKNIN